MNGQIRILIVDDNQMMRFGLSGSLAALPDVTVVGEAANGEEALALVAEHRPDIVTMDYRMPGDNGLVVTEKILAQYPEIRVILLSAFDSEEDIWNAVQVGVKGYLTKAAGNVTELLAAVKAVAAGEQYFPEVIARKLKERQKVSGLSAREVDVLRLLAVGKSNQEIADSLDIALETVKSHLLNLRSKLGAADRTQAVVLAYEKGILHLNE